MLDAISGVKPYMSNLANSLSVGASRVWYTQRAQRAAMPELPVQPVRAVTAVADASAKAEPVGLGLPQGAAAELAEMNVRQNLRPFEGEQLLAASVGGAWWGEKTGSTELPQQLLRLANAQTPDAPDSLGADAKQLPGMPADAADEAARWQLLGGHDAENEKFQLRLPGAPKEEEPFNLLDPAKDEQGDKPVDSLGDGKDDGKSSLNGAQEAAEDGKCQTCEKRKYQDGSNDAGVSFKTPTRIDPSQVASAVRGHEMEHVFREQAKAKREGRKVVSQSVTYHNAICPECGRVYIAGGTTRTSTMAANASNQVLANHQQAAFGNGLNDNAA